MIALMVRYSKQLQSPPTEIDPKSSRQFRSTILKYLYFCLLISFNNYN
jgi:hypothetical protein